MRGLTTSGSASLLVADRLEDVEDLAPGREGLVELLLVVIDGVDELELLVRQLVLVDPALRRAAVGEVLEVLLATARLRAAAVCRSG